MQCNDVVLSKAPFLQAYRLMKIFLTERVKSRENLMLLFRVLRYPNATPSFEELEFNIANYVQQANCYYHLGFSISTSQEKGVIVVNSYIFIYFEQECWPSSLKTFVQQSMTLSLDRTLSPSVASKTLRIGSHIARGMNQKKLHEVSLTVELTHRESCVCYLG